MFTFNGIEVIRCTLPIVSNMGDAFSGLLLLHGGNYSNNDSKDDSTTPTTNDSKMTPTSNNDSGLTPTSDDSMDVTPTSLTAATKRRKYKKRGGTSFIYERRDA